MSAKTFCLGHKGLEEKPGKKTSNKLTKQKKYEFMAQKKLKAIHSKQNGGRKREHLSTSEKMTNSAKINNPRRNGQSPLSRKKQI